MIQTQIGPLNLSFSLIYIIAISWTMTIILKPFISNIFKTTFIDSIVIISVASMFVNLILAFIARLVALAGEEVPTYFEYTISNGDGEVRCPEFRVNFSSENFTPLDKMVFICSLLVWVSGGLALGSFLVTMFFWVGDDESEGEDIHG